MTPYDFLSSLPAVLGILGFVIFYFLKQQGKGDPATLKIIEKLRADAPERLKEHSKLNSKQLFQLLTTDTSLREKISNQDFLLLQQTLKQQFIVTLTVYSLCSVLFLVGVGLFTYQINKPETLNINSFSLSSTSQVAQGLAVDTDPLKIQWVAKGETKNINVYIENIDSGTRSTEFPVLSNSGSLEILPADFEVVLRNRTPFQWNRVRIIAQSEDDSFTSKEFKLYVGITILGINFGDKVKIGAMVDNSVIQRYNFEALLVVWSNDDVDTLSFGQSITNGQRDFPIENSEDYNWAGAKLSYLGPDDTRLVRTEIIYD